MRVGRDDLGTRLGLRRTGVVLFDKSAIQALSHAETLEFRRTNALQNLPPILMYEVHGDLAKTYADGRSTDGMVRGLAAKLLGPGVTLNVHHTEACLSDLVGRHPDIEVCGVLAEGARTVRGPDGTLGMYVEQPRKDVAVARWFAGSFTPAEREWAVKWRTRLRTLTVTHLVARLTKRRIILPRPENENALYEVVDDLVDRTSLQTEWLEYLFQELRPSPELLRVIRSRWSDARVPLLSRFAPYAHHCLRVALALAVASRHRLIRWEPSNVLDAQYLYYLPFCELFVSGDHIHRKLSPALLNQHQRFMALVEFKEIIRAWIRARAEQGEQADQGPDLSE